MIGKPTLSLSTLLLALLSSWELHGHLSWDAVLLLVAVVLAADRGAASFRRFFVRDGAVKGSGYALLIGIGLMAFTVVLGLFLSLWTGWPLMLLGAAGLAAALAYSIRGVPGGPWGELVTGLVPGTVLWVSAAFVLSPDSRWSLDFWWHALLLSVPSALFLSSLATVKRVTETEARHSPIVLLPLAAYLALGGLAFARLVPWTFFPVLVAGPAVTAPLWRSMFRRGFGRDQQRAQLQTALQSLWIYSLLSAAAWVTGIALP